MGKFNKKLSFDKNYLNKLKEDPNACVEIHKELYHLALHPFHLNDLNSSIKGILDQKIAKYDKKLGGILLGYQNIKLLDATGAINFDSCFVHSNIEADFYIFKPVVGQVLIGIVSKKSKEHVGCLVHKTFNVSLPKPENCEDWIGQSTQLGQEIQFEINFTDLDGKLPYIRGKILSIVSDDSGFSTSEEPNTNETKQNTIMKFDDSDDDSNTEIHPDVKKRKLERSTSLSEIEPTSKKAKYDYGSVEKGCENESFKTLKKHKHKDKKYKRRDLNAISQSTESSELIDDIVDNASTKKLKKKHKHIKEAEIENFDNINFGNHPVKEQDKKKKSKHLIETNTTSLNKLDLDDDANMKTMEHKYWKESESVASTSNIHIDDVIKVTKKKKHKRTKEPKMENYASSVNFDNKTSEETGKAILISKNNSNDDTDKKQSKKKKHKYSQESELDTSTTNTHFDNVTKIHKKKKDKHMKEPEVKTNATKLKITKILVDDSEAQSRTHVKKKRKKNNID